MRVRCIFVNTKLWGKKPVNAAYPDELVTLGDHLRKVRLDRGLSQPQVAKLLKATPDTVTGWELNRHEPPARFAKRIIQFIGYFPFNNDRTSIGRQLYNARLLSGKTQEQVAKLTGCDESNLRLIENGKRKPYAKTCARLQKFINNAFKVFTQSSL